MTACASPSSSQAALISCRKCGEELPPGEFYADPSRKSGRKPDCRACWLEHYRTKKVRLPKDYDGPARPGCIIYRGAALALTADETWVAMPVRECRKCGLDQHLPECLECLDTANLPIEEDLVNLLVCES